MRCGPPPPLLPSVAGLAKEPIILQTNWTGRQQQVGSANVYPVLVQSKQPWLHPVVGG